MCDYAFPAQHGKLCMVGIFDVIFVQDVPRTHPSAAIGFSIMGEPGEQVQMKLEIIGPSGAVLFTVEPDFVLPDAGNAFGHMPLPPLQLKEFGRYAIQIDVGSGAPKAAWFSVKELKRRP